MQTGMNYTRAPLVDDPGTHAVHMAGRPLYHEEKSVI